MSNVTIQFMVSFYAQCDYNFQEIQNLNNLMYYLRDYNLSPSVAYIMKVDMNNDVTLGTLLTYQLFTLQQHLIALCNANRGVFRVAECSRRQ